MFNSLFIHSLHVSQQSVFIMVFKIIIFLYVRGKEGCLGIILSKCSVFFTILLHRFLFLFYFFSYSLVSWPKTSDRDHYTIVPVMCKYKMYGISSTCCSECNIGYNLILTLHNLSIALFL